MSKNVMKVTKIKTQFCEPVKNVCFYFDYKKDHNRKCLGLTTLASDEEIMAG